MPFTFSEQLTQLHQRGITGKGVAIGHLDSGIATKHPAFLNRIADFCSINEQGNVQQSSIFEDATGHGTQTASLICGNADQTHFVGAAPESVLYTVGIEEDQNNLLKIITALAWLYQQPIDVLCIPMGIPYQHPLLEYALRPFVAKNIPIIAPIGNYGVNTYCAPACYADAIGVGAVNTANEIQAYSGSKQFSGIKRLTKPDICCVGHQVVAAKKKGGYGKATGTSMACASLAGCYALLKQAFPKVSSLQFKQVFQQTAFQPEPAWKHRYGHGVIQPLAAFQYLQEHTMSPIPTVTTSVLPWIETALSEALEALDDQQEIALLINSIPLEVLQKHALLVLHDFQVLKLMYIQGKKATIQLLLEEIKAPIASTINVEVIGAF